MNIWGSIPDWLSFVLALLVFFGFAVNQREKLILEKKDIAKGNESDPNSITEINVDIRAELYSRILIGIMLGVALVPIYSWVYSGSYQGDSFYYSIPYETENITKSTIAVISAMILSVFLSFVYFRAYPKLSSIFVHWAERFAFSYVGFWFILLFAYLRSNSETHTYFLDIDKFMSIVISVIMLVLVGFPSTPIDWIIHLTSKFGAKKTLYE